GGIIGIIGIIGIAGRSAKAARGTEEEEDKSSRSADTLALPGSRGLWTCERCPSLRPPRASKMMRQVAVAAVYLTLSVINTSLLVEQGAGRSTAFGACAFSSPAAATTARVLPPSSSWDVSDPSSSRRRRRRLQVASISSSQVSSTVPTRQQLEKMTVKQLRLFIEEKGIDVPRGSNLKLKKQIVDFIWNWQCESERADGGEDVRRPGESVVTGDDPPQIHAESQANGSRAKRTSSMKRGGMPPLASDSINEPLEGSKSATPDSPYMLTPKDRIVLQVLDRYPPLHESIVKACSLTPEMETLDGITTSNIEQCDLSAIDYAVPDGIGEDDMRHTYHPMLKNVSQSDMDLVFIGTASCTPGTTRGVSCTALRLNWRSVSTGRAYDQGAENSNYIEDRGAKGGTWIFDCGEGTQLSVQRTSSIKPGKISKIFITHSHGDHSFGLPGLLCLMGTDRDRSDPPVEIYGPEGLRMWLRVAIRYSVSRVVPPYRVHELMDVPMAPEWVEGHRKNGRFYYQLRRDPDNPKNKSFEWTNQGLAGEDANSWISRAPMMNLGVRKLINIQAILVMLTLHFISLPQSSRDFGEQDGGRDIYPRYDHPKCSGGAPIWEVEVEDDVCVHAAPMSHSVPCVGYVVTEQDKPGRLKPENVLPVIDRNRQGLIDAGIRNPMKVMAMVKSLPVGGSYSFPDGTIINQEDVVEPPRRGRKIAICGDTANCRALASLAQDADVLIHEATNTFLPGVDKDGDLRGASRDAKIHGHSTPHMAGEFARRINAKKLILNHFSARYKGDQSIDSMTIMTRIEKQAMKAAQLPEDCVAASWDFMVLPLSNKT
ncbi:hypothetical protein THAOC_00370, partial [Thalassiosira oceanica]